MTRRNRIQAKISSNLDKISKLKKQNADLEKEALLLCDKVQWFTEEIEEVKVRDGKKWRKENWLIGKIHWNEVFQDESKPGKEGEVVVERCSVVRVNGEWEF